MWVRRSCVTVWCCAFLAGVVADCVCMCFASNMSRCARVYVVVAGRKRGERFHGRVAGAIVLEQVFPQYLCTYATRRTNCCLSAANRLPLATSARRAPAEGPKMVDITVQVH